MRKNWNEWCVFCTVHFDVLRKCDKQTNKHQYNHAGQSFFAPSHPLLGSHSIDDDLTWNWKYVKESNNEKTFLLLLLCNPRGNACKFTLNVLIFFPFHLSCCLKTKLFFRSLLFVPRRKRNCVWIASPKSTHKARKERRRQRHTHEYVRALFYKKGYMRVCALHKQLDSI